MAKLTNKKVKELYFEESSDIWQATEEQVNKLDEWLDKNDYVATATERWYNLQEEIQYMTVELEYEFG